MIKVRNFLRVIAWIKVHRKQLIFVGISIPAIMKEIQGKDKPERESDLDVR